MTNWVIDASVALAWILPDERSVQADRYLEGFGASAALWVPPLWWYEVTNGLCTARRKGRLSQADLHRVVALLEELPVKVDPLLGGPAIRGFAALAEEHSLSGYDAAYLELALRKGAMLATLDRGLAVAARKAGVSVAPA